MATKSDDVRRSPVAALIYGAPIGLLGHTNNPPMTSNRSTTLHLPLDCAEYRGRV